MQLGTALILCAIGYAGFYLYKNEPKIFKLLNILIGCVGLIILLLLMFA